MPDAGHLASIYGHLHDVGYVAVGYSLTLVALAAIGGISLSGRAGPAAM